MKFNEIRRKFKGNSSSESKNIRKMNAWFWFCFIYLRFCNLENQCPLNFLWISLHVLEFPMFLLNPLCPPPARQEVEASGGGGKVIFQGNTRNSMKFNEIRMKIKGNSPSELKNIRKMKVWFWICFIFFWFCNLENKLPLNFLWISLNFLSFLEFPVRLLNPWFPPPARPEDVKKLAEKLPSLSLSLSLSFS